MPSRCIGLLLVMATAVAACPPKGFDSVAKLDLAKYIAAPWYVQQQVPLRSQGPETLFCVRARYVPVDKANLTAGIIVINYANRGKVNGPAMGVSGAAGNTSFSLFALPAPVGPGPTAASKLLVGPRQFLERAPAAAVAARLNATAGNYWVVAVGPSKDPGLGYDWAIINGGSGAPSEANGGGGGGCRPSATRDEGLWLFSRKQVAPSDQLQTMRDTATRLGYDLSRLLPVKQEGCKYEGADGGSDKGPSARSATAG